MKANSCIHFATQRYCGSDQMISFQGIEWLGSTNTIHLSDRLIPEPQDPSLDQLKSLGYLLRGPIHKEFHD